MDLQDIDTGATCYLKGEAVHQAQELDYFDGTGLSGGWTAEITALCIDVNGKEYEIAAHLLPADLLQHLSEAAADTLE